MPLPRNTKTAAEFFIMAVENMGKVDSEAFIAKTVSRHTRPPERLTLKDVFAVRCAQK